MKQQSDSPLPVPSSLLTATPLLSSSLPLLVSTPPSITPPNPTPPTRNPSLLLSFCGIHVLRASKLCSRQWQSTLRAWKNKGTCKDDALRGFCMQIELKPATGLCIISFFFFPHLYHFKPQLHWRSNNPLLAKANQSHACEWLHSGGTTKARTPDCKKKKV